MIWKKVACPRCGSPIGFPCRYPSGKKYPGPHRERHIAAIDEAEKKAASGA